MPRKAKVMPINEDSTYGDVAEAIVENEKAESQETEPNEAPVVEPPKPKARAKRVSKPKVVVADAAVDVDTPVEVETPTPVLEPKPKAKRATKPKVVEPPPVVEEPVVKPKAVRKPRAPKQELPVQKPVNQVPPFPPRLSRTAAREALYHSLASGGLS